jgi:superfamily II DNA helicase RecQ
MPEKRVRPARDPDAPKKAPSGGLRGALRELRRREARRRRWKPYQVFPDVTLDAIVKTRPTTTAELLAIHGLGTTRVAKFGEQILAVLRDFP